MSPSSSSTIVANPVQHGDESNIRQVVQGVPSWQDSVVLVWWDSENTIGGFHRLGHEPNSPGGGKAVLWSHITFQSGTIKRTQSLALREEDVLPRGGFGSGDESCTVEFDDGKHIWTIKDENAGMHGRLVHVDTGPNVDCFPRDANTKSFAAAHLDIPGTVTGQITIKNNTYSIHNGMSIRDHGWGGREWGSALLSHRWIVGTSGPKFSFFAIAWHSTNDRYANFGWVVQDDTVKAAKHIDIVTYMNDDSLTNRGGRIGMQLVDGEEFLIECTPVAKPYISCYNGVTCVDRLCRFDAVGGDKTFRGFGDYENTSNFHAGQRAPGFLTEGTLENGFTAAEVTLP